MSILQYSDAMTTLSIPGLCDQCQDYSKYCGEWHHLKRYKPRPKENILTHRVRTHWEAPTLPLVRLQVGPVQHAGPAGARATPGVQGRVEVVQESKRGGG